MDTPMNKNTLLFSTLVTTLALGACSDGTVSGGGAGDTEDSALAVALITPLVGIYDLPENWRGQPVSEAYLDIQDPADNGIAASVVYLLDSMNNCIETGSSPGEITKDPFSDRLFLDSFNFGNAVITREDNDLVISLTADVQDIDNDNDFDEPNSLRAPRLNADLPPFCT